METKTKKRTGPVIFSGYERGTAIKKALSMNREDILLEIRIETKRKRRRRISNFYKMYANSSRFER